MLSSVRKYADVPVYWPSREPPLSLVNSTMVLSHSPMSSRWRRSRPKLRSMLWTMPAYTSM